jgi:hypothetical protein
LVRLATLVVFLFGVPAFASAQAGPCAPRLYGFDPYKPSDLAILRQYGSSVLANAPLSSLLQLDPYVPSEALLLRQYGGALPLWPFVWYPTYLPPAYPPGCSRAPEVAAPQMEASARPPITTFAELLNQLERAPQSQAAAPPSAGRPAPAPAVSVERTMGASIEFEGRRWVSAGRAVAFDGARFVRVGESGASAVFRVRGAKDEVIFVPTTPGMVAPFRAASK